MTTKPPSWKTERKVLIALLALLLMPEIALRLVESRLSVNVRHVIGIPRVAEELKQSRGTKFLIVGNSLIDNAVNDDLFRRALLTRGFNPAVVAKAIPDGSNIWDWYFLYKKFFLQQKATPAFIVNGFAWGFLSDQIRPNPSRLAAFFADVCDLPELISLGMRDVGQIAEFALARLSRVYAHREVIRNRIFVSFMSEYKPLTQKLNAESLARGPGLNIRGQSETYHVLSKLGQAARASNSRLVIVAMPVVAPYQLDPRLPAIAQSLGIELLDYRRLPFVDEGSFMDPIHLKPEAGVEFGSYLAADLAEHEQAQPVNDVVLDRVGYGTLAKAHR
jgi:hypothetical protein